MTGKHARGRRSESFGVRRWLQLGAASAGVSAALFGLSSLGPQVGVALADESGASSSDSSGSTGSDSGGSSTGGTGSGSEQSSSPGSAAESGPKTSVGSSPSSPSSPSSSVKHELDTEKDDTEKDEPKKVTTTTDDDEEDEGEGEGSVSSSSSNKTPKPPPAALASTSTATPDITKTVAPKTESAPAIAAAEPTPPWAVQVEAPEDPRKQFISDQLAAWTRDSLGWIDSLPVPGALKWHLEGALWTMRRSLLNVAPAVAPLTVTGLSNALVSGRVDAVDPENDAIVYRLVRGPSSGTVELNSDGSFTYTPSDGFNGVDSFVVLAQDLGLHVNLLAPFRGAGTAASALVNQGAIKFDFNYTTGSEYWSPEARDALHSAANTLAAYFLVTAPRVLTYDVKGQNQTEGTTLASAGSDLISNDPGFWSTVVQYKLQTGVDANGDLADGRITWNWANSWSLGDTVADDSFDFASTAMHELMHSFGFSSYVLRAGSNTDQYWTIFASYIVTADGREPIDPDLFWNEDFDGNLTGGDGGFYFAGANAVAAYGKPVPLYTPNPWEGGSSMSHLDDTTFTGPDEQMMNAVTDEGLGVRVLSPIELGIMKDLGYLVAVPSSSAKMTPWHRL